MTTINAKIQIANSDDPERNVWLSLPFSEEEFDEALQGIGASEDDAGSEFDRIVAGEEPSSHYFIKSIRDDDNLFEERHIMDYDAFRLSDLAEQIENLQSWEYDTMKALIECGNSLEDAVEKAEDGDVEFYPNTNLTELAEQFGDEELFSKEFLLQHVDWEAIGRELSLDGYVEVGGGVIRTP